MSLIGGDLMGIILMDMRWLDWCVGNLIGRFCGWKKGWKICWRGKDLRKKKLSCINWDWIVLELWKCSWICKLYNGLCMKLLEIYKWLGR